MLVPSCLYLVNDAHAALIRLLISVVSSCSKLSVLHKKSHIILLSCSRDVENNSTSSTNRRFERQSACRSQTDAHAFLLPSCQVVFQCSLQNRVEQKGYSADRLALDLPFISNTSLSFVKTVAFWSAKSLFRRLMCCGWIPNCASGALCFIVSSAFAKSNVAIHI